MIYSRSEIEDYLLQCLSDNETVLLGELPQFLEQVEEELKFIWMLDDVKSNFVQQCTSQTDQVIAVKDAVGLMLELWQSSPSRSTSPTQQQLNQFHQEQNESLCDGDGDHLDPTPPTTGKIRKRLFTSPNLITFKENLSDNSQQRTSIVQQKTGSHAEDDNAAQYVQSSVTEVSEQSFSLHDRSSQSRLKVYTRRVLQLEQLVEEKEYQIQGLNKDIQDGKLELSKCKDQLQTLQGEKQQLAEELSQCRVNLEKMKKENRQLSVKVGQLMESRETLKLELSEKNDELQRLSKMSQSLTAGATQRVNSADQVQRLKEENSRLHDEILMLQNQIADTDGQYDSIHPIMSRGGREPAFSEFTSVLVQNVNDADDKAIQMQQQQERMQDIMTRLNGPELSTIHELIEKNPDYADDLIEWLSGLKEDVNSVIKEILQNVNDLRQSKRKYKHRVRLLENECEHLKDKISRLESAAQQSRSSAMSSVGTGKFSDLIEQKNQELAELKQKVQELTLLSQQKNLHVNDVILNDGYETSREMEARDVSNVTVSKAPKSPRKIKISPKKTPARILFKQHTQSLSLLNKVAYLLAGTLAGVVLLFMLMSYRDAVQLSQSYEDSIFYDNVFDKVDSVFIPQEDKDGFYFQLMSIMYKVLPFMQ
ncbi:hypothetical protein MP228_003119 [Amoeboaphelidium protococcarum]|nr:hypothetical protein MP228_003119 [Amoeboaphelidium protococcarum]